MRLVPCNGGCAGKVGYALLPDGTPYIMGQTPTFPFRVKCYRCREVFWLREVHWNRAPRVSTEVLRELERAEGGRLVEAYTKDHVGSGLTQSQAEDMIDAGIPGPGSAELTRSV